MANSLILTKAQNAITAHDWATAARLYKELLRSDESNVEYLNYTEQPRSGYKCGNGQSHCVRRHFVDRLKTTVVHLLIAANFVELHGFYNLFIVEIGNIGIVKRDMPVLAYSHYHYIGRVCF